jgi:predicted metal-dependent hydrolase
MIQKAEIRNLEVEYEVVHRKVKNARLEIKTDQIRIIMPLNHFNHEEIIRNHEKWIYNKIRNIKALQLKAEKKELNSDVNEDVFRTMVRDWILEFSNDLGVDFNRVFFKKMRSRWGSCSSKKNLNINRYLMFLPNNLVEYVVFHEVAHLVEMSHNKKFWHIISTRFPNYKDLENELLIYWLKMKNFIENGYIKI